MNSSRLNLEITSDHHRYEIGFDGYLYILSYVFEEQFIEYFPLAINQVGLKS